MPKSSVPKAKTASKASGKAESISTAICDGCCSAIVEDQDEAIQCEGTCQKWHHRLCAGVSKFHYDELASSPRAFICWLCSNSLHSAAIQNLQQEIESLKASMAANIESSRAEIAALKKDNADLKAAFERKLSQLPVNCNAPSGDTSTTTATMSYASAVRQDQPNDRRPGRNRRQRQNRNRNQQRNSGNAAPIRETEANETAASQNSRTAPGSQSDRSIVAGPKEAVKGARRVWGTLRSATSTSVKNSIVHLTKSNASDIHVKRKFQSTRSGKGKWWFILRGNEDCLQALENDWEAVKFQTGWQLEYCTKPIVIPSPTDPLPATPMATTQCETPANHQSESLTFQVSNSSDVSDSPDGDNADAPANTFLGN